jgi:hypothetical protein
MIHPAPTTPIDPSLARGVLAAVVPATATRPGHIVASFPNTNYEMHLLTPSPVRVEIGKRLVGTIRAEARRLDVVDTGGRYVEPVYGRPRRVQGRVIATDADRNVVVVDATVPIHLKLTDARQRAADFPAGELVSCDVMEGATFTQAG